MESKKTKPTKDIKGKKKSETNVLYHTDKKDILIGIGKFIIFLRKRAGHKSSEKFANEKGLPRTWFGDIERGKRDIQLTSFFKILAAFNLSPKEFWSKYESYINDAAESASDKTK